MPEVSEQPSMKRPTSKQPNPRKFHPTNRFLLPFHHSLLPNGKKMTKQIVTDRKPGTIIKSNDGRHTYQVLNNGAIVKVHNPQ